MSSSDAMTTGGSGRNASPFGRLTLLFVILVGFAAFMALLYFLSGGDDGSRDNNGAAHAAARGLNGYAGLVRLLEQEDYEVSQSRSLSGLETYDLLVLTPPSYMDPDEIEEILWDRQYTGPTLVILPKWYARRPGPNLPDETADKFKRGWVELGDAFEVNWSNELPSPFGFEHKVEQLQDDVASDWSGLALSGSLPSRQIAFAEKDDANQALITASDDRVLAMRVGRQNAAENEYSDEYYDNTEGVIFVVEPDLVNNYGLADENRAAAALALVQAAGYGPGTGVTFDLTLNGFGGTVNLLTLAFRPPFLAATLCLILAIIIVGWRAFLRFGPAAASGPDIAFGKKQLVGNGAGLIVRAGRLKLLAEPYANLSARRMARALALGKPDPDAIDAALRARLPQEEPFTHRAARLQNAGTASDIVRAAQSLNALVTLVETSKSNKGTPAQ